MIYRGFVILFLFWPTLGVLAQQISFVKQKASDIYGLEFEDLGIEVRTTKISVQNSDISISGKWIKGKKKIIFVPDYPFEERVWYCVKTGGRDTLMRLPEKKNKTSFVTRIYPLTDSIPENLLRFYVYFNAPMQQGNFPRHIHLYNEANDDLRHAFFDDQRELWNKDFTRLTILLDPGRIKSGLEVNRRMGRVFIPKQVYRLVIDKGWKDIEGFELQSSYTKTFSVVQEDIVHPDINSWNIKFPKDRKDFLQILFNDKMDHTGIEQYIAITDAAQTRIKGKMYLQRGETSVVFVPTKKWKKGEYILYINARTEDIAGNNINGLLDHNVGALKSQMEGNIETIRFFIR